MQLFPFWMPLSTSNISKCRTHIFKSFQWVWTLHHFSPSFAKSHPETDFHSFCTATWHWEHFISAKIAMAKGRPPCSSSQQVSVDVYKIIHCCAQLDICCPTKVSSILTCLFLSMGRNSPWQSQSGCKWVQSPCWAEGVYQQDNVPL